MSFKKVSFKWPLEEPEDDYFEGTNALKNSWRDKKRGSSVSPQRSAIRSFPTSINGFKKEDAGRRRPLSADYGNDTCELLFKIQFILRTRKKLQSFEK